MARLGLSSLYFDLNRIIPKIFKGKKKSFFIVFKILTPSTRYWGKIWGCVCVCVLNRVWRFVTVWTHGLEPARLLGPWNFPGKNTGVGSQFPPARDLPDPGIKPSSPASSALQAGKPRIPRIGTEKELQDGLWNWTCGLKSWPGHCSVLGFPDMSTGINVFLQNRGIVKT